MLDFEHESLVTLSQACKWVPRIGRRTVTPRIVWRWATRGVRGVKLEVLRRGRIFMTSKQALIRFFERLDEPVQLPTAGDPATPAGPRTPRQREAAIRRAERELAAEGIA